MPLIASISGIRGVFGDGLTPAILVRYASAFGAWLVRQSARQPVVVVGRDGRVTGDVCARLVTAALQSVGCHVVYASLATTPTVEMAVLREGADGGIILSASHNPAEWNALKLLDHRGEFLSAEQGTDVLDLADSGQDFTVDFERVGSYRTADFLPFHVEAIVNLPYIDPAAIRQRGFRVVVDGINSVGGIAMPAMLAALGVEDVHVLNGEPTGRFAHSPEPLPENLAETVEQVAALDADLGLVVDPDVDRLAFIDENGRFIGEEKTQVLAADFLMRRQPGPFATNLSSSRLIEDVMERFGHPVHRSAVGEAHVVATMKEVGAVLGGEGNGGVILPDLHYGRDALVGAAMVLQHLAETGLSLSEAIADYPEYHLAKHRLDLDGLDARKALARLADRYRGRDDAGVSTIDGVKVDLPEGWVHLRTSNTEPILRIYAEARTASGADDLARRFRAELLEPAP
jgi:phosphomannomutase